VRVATALTTNLANPIYPFKGGEIDNTANHIRLVNGGEGTEALLPCDLAVGQGRGK